jgi:hypothetical protein
MTDLVIRTLTALALLAALISSFGQSAEAAPPKTVTGPTALSLAAVIAQHSPLLSSYEKKVIAGLFNGNANAGAASKKKLSITADSVVCKVSNVDLTARSCEIIFKTGKSTSFKGREANEVFATLAMAGVASDGAAGSIFETVKKLNCSLDPAVIKDKSGGGADCSFETEG